MNAKLLTLVIGCGLVATAGLVSADPRAYINAKTVGDFVAFVDCSGVDPGIGGVCFEGGHFDSPDETLSIVDAFKAPVSGFVCQDSNGDSLCGDSAAGEPADAFCGTITITEPPYDFSLATIVFIDGLVFGNPVISLCGTLSAGWLGEVHHA